MREISEIQELLRASKYTPSTKMVDDITRNVRKALTEAPVQTTVFDWLKIVALPASFAAVVISFSVNTDTKELQPQGSPLATVQESIAPILAQSVDQIDYAKLPNEVLF